MSKARAIGVSFLFATLGATAVPAQALTISFNDMSDQMTVAADGVIQGFADEKTENSIGEVVVLPDNAPKTVNDFFTLTEPAGGDGTAGTLSDILQLSTVAGSNHYEITFTSDQEAALAGPPRAPFGTAQEINGFLFIQDPVNGVQPPNSFLFPTDQVHPPGLIIEMASDVNNVPVPAALPLFATGLGGLGLLGWRRKRKRQ